MWPAGSSVIRNRASAERSQRAAVEINTLSAETVERAQNAGHRLAELVPAIAQTSDLVAHITAACRDLNDEAARIDQAIDRQNQVIRLTARSSEDMTATSERLASQARSLANGMAYIRLQ